MTAAQASPTYGFATGKSEEPIVREIVRKYGYSNLSWPLVLSKGGKTVSYLYERNSRNKTNSSSDNRPHSRSGIESCYIDYTTSPRVSEPLTYYSREMTSSEYNRSYDYILESPYSTVDLDYVWFNGEAFVGFELTTFWVEFRSEDRALDLVSKMNRRPSWQGESGAHAFHKIVDSAIDLNVDFYLVCANTISRVGSDLKTDGNVLFFRLTHDAIDRLSSGLPPMDYTFCTFHSILEWI